MSAEGYAMTNLGQLEQLTMLAVLHLGEEAYGSSIRDELELRAGRSVALGTVYVTLKRLENKGLVRSWLGEPTPARGGKAKRYYAVEPVGAEALRSAHEASARMWKDLPPDRRPA
jgi:DNA-binding PadR family transcriptional regulator